MESQWHVERSVFRVVARTSSQWRGRAGFAPASVSPFGLVSCSKKVAGAACGRKSGGGEGTTTLPLPPANLFALATEPTALLAETPAIPVE